MKNITREQLRTWPDFHHRAHTDSKTTKKFEQITYVITDEGTLRRLTGFHLTPLGRVFAGWGYVVADASEILVLVIPLAQFCVLSRQGNLPCSSGGKGGGGYAALHIAVVV